MFWPQEKKIVVKEKEELNKAPVFKRNIRNISSKQIEIKQRIET